jgi:hypothetical protein
VPVQPVFRAMNHLLVLAFCVIVLALIAISWSIERRC